MSGIIGQAKAQENLGVKLGVNISFGTHVSRLGLMYQLYYFKDLVQLSNGATIHYNLKNIGPKGKYWEAKMYGGFQFYGGEEYWTDTYLISEYSLMAPKLYSGGYLFQYYFDKVATSQAAGGFHFKAGHFSMVMENDLFGFYKGHHDKYRTGAFLFAWQNGPNQWAIQTTMWTGNCKESKRVKHSNYPSRYGYKDLRDASYGKISHGILAFRFDRVMDYEQSLRLEAGIDHERVRHLFQNKVVHDLIIRSKNSKLPGNPHVPMLQQSGMPFLYQEGENVKEGRFYLQTGLNNLLFY